MDVTERVAKAIYEGRNGAGCKPWSRLPSGHRAPYLGDALIAIEAMFKDSRMREFNGQIVIVNPDFPPEVWDGEKLVDIKPVAALSP